MWCLTSDAQCTAAPCLVEDGNTALLMEFDPTDFFIFQTGSRTDMSYFFMYFAAKTRWTPWFPLFWEESAFQHWSLQKWQKLTKVVDTSLLHKRTVGSTSTLFGSCLDWYASTLSKDCEGHNPTSDASPQSAMDSMLLQAIWSTSIKKVCWPILRVTLIFSSRDEEMRMLETAEPTCKALWQVLDIYCNIVIDQIYWCVYIS